MRPSNWMQLLERDNQMKTLTLAIALPILIVWVFVFFSLFKFEVRRDDASTETAAGVEWHSAPHVRLVPRTADR